MFNQTSPKFLVSVLYSNSCNFKNGLYEFFSIQMYVNVYICMYLFFNIHTNIEGWTYLALSRVTICCWIQFFFIDFHIDLVYINIFRVSVDDPGAAFFYMYKCSTPLFSFCQLKNNFSWTILFWVLFSIVALAKWSL